MKYRPEIDGLRAIAVVPVILFHAGFEVFSGGFLGVDVFFVISGYLITTIIATELDRGQFSISSFYKRRARRILPALFIVILACIPFAWMWLMPQEMENFARSVVAASTFWSNLLFLGEIDYFDTAAELKPLLHTWSLSVEEQYYIIFPLLLIILGRRSKKIIALVLFSLLLASLAAAQIASQANPPLAFFSLHTRFWELMLGGLCALFLKSPANDFLEHSVQPFLAATGLFLILFAVFWFDEFTPTPSIYTLVPTLGAALIIVCARPKSFVSALLGNRLLVGIGLISYSAYLWHYPILTFARHRYYGGFPPENMMAGLVVLSFTMAYLSWRFVEKPFRRRTAGDTRRVLVTAGTAMGVFCLAGVFLGSDYVQAIRLSDHQAALYETVQRSPKRDDCHTREGDDYKTKAACEYFAGPTKVALIGNSHGVEVAYAIALQLEPANLALRHYTVSSCTMAYETKIRTEKNRFCVEWHRHIVKKIIDDNTIEVVVISYRGDTVANNSDRLGGLRRLISTLKDNGKEIILVFQAPKLKSHIDKYILFSNDRSHVPAGKRSDWVKEYSPIYQIAGEFEKEIFVVDPADRFCDVEQCYAIKEGVALYYDDHHMSVPGAQLVAKDVVPIILAVLDGR